MTKDQATQTRISKRGSLRFFLLTYLIPYVAIFLSSVIFFSWFIGNVLIEDLRQQYTEKNVQALEQYILTTRNNLRKVQSIRDYVYQDQELKVSPNLTDVKSAKATIKNLAKYYVVNSEIEEIGLYFHGDRYLYTATTSYPVESFYRKYIDLENKTWQAVSEAVAAESQFNQKYLFKESGKNSVMFNYPMVIGGKMATLIMIVDLTGSFVFDNDSFFIIRNIEGEVIASVNFPRDNDEAEFLQRWDKEQEANKKRSLEVKPFSEKEEYIISQENLGQTGWSFLYANPISKVYGKVSRMQNNYVMVLAAFVLISLTFIYYGIRTNYRPISRIAKIARDITSDEEDGEQTNSLGNIEHALASLATQNASLRKTVADKDKLDFLQKVLRGSAAKEEVEERIRQGDLQLLDCAHRAVLCVTLGKLHSIRFEEIDFSKIERWLQEILPGYIYPLDEKQSFSYIAGLVDENEEKYPDVLHRIHLFLREKLKTDILITAGNVLTRDTGLSEAFMEVYLAMEYRFVIGENGVVLLSDTKDKGETQGTNLNPIFTRLEHNLERGVYEEVADSLEALEDHIRENRYSLYYIKGLCYQLMTSINQVVSKLQQEQRMDFSDLPDQAQIIRLDTAEELLETEQRICREICKRVADSKETQRDELAERMKDYIRQNFDDLNFTAQGMADEFGMSLSNLSQYFKNHNHTTISNYLTEIRMNQAKDLILKGNIPVKDIAVKVGYLNTSSFIRKFKSLHGVTPNQYTEEHRKKEF